MTHAKHQGRSSVRRAAFEVLLESEASSRFVDEVLQPKLSGFDERDRHLLQELAFGVLRHRNTLDRTLDFHLKHPTAKQKPLSSWALRLGAYQLVYLSRVPPHAAVNQTLEALKTFQGITSNDVGFVNAVLHKISAEVQKKVEEAPADADDPAVLPIRRGCCYFARPVLPNYRTARVEHLAFKYSHPTWLVDRWLQRLGEEETRALLQVDNATPTVTARVTSLAPSREALLAVLEEYGWKVAVGHLEDSIVIERWRNLDQAEAFTKGWFQIQDETAIRIGALLAPPPGARVLDLCSAPGGKAAQLLERVGPEGHVVAADRSEDKLDLVRQNLSKFGTNYTTVVLPDDPTHIELGETFSHILVDAPCSNTGVLARRPEARWRIRAKDIEALGRRQQALVEAALRHLQPGGRLVYSTCSIEPEENENVVAQVFAKNPDLTERETHLYLPHRTFGDGGFSSLILKNR